MPKKANKKRVSKKTGKAVIPPWGRSSKDLDKDIGRLRRVSADVPLGNTDPTVVHGKLFGGMPNASRKATGGLRAQRGRRGG